MPKFNIGRDLAVSISLSGNVVKQFGLHTSSHFRPQWTEAKVRPTNNGGQWVVRPIFGGHEIEITYARQNGTGDAIAQYLEDLFKAGGADPVVSMMETIRNDDGTVDQFNYLNGTIYQTDGGDFKGVDEVSQAFKFFFPERKLVSSSNQAPTFGGQALP